MEVDGLYGEALALWMVAPGQAEIRPARARAPRPGFIRVRALVSGISRGTESLVFRGLGLVAEIKSALLAALERHRLDSPTELVGTDAAAVTAEPWPV